MNIFPLSGFLIGRNEMPKYYYTNLVHLLQLNIEWTRLQHVEETHARNILLKLAVNQDGQTWQLQLQ